MVAIAIFDYGAGNIFSLRNSLERAGADVSVITELGGKNSYSGIVLPGGGSFDPALKKMKGLQEYASGVPVLGICLGMEAFFERSDEGTESGLGVMPGEVVLLPDTIKVPHMGWNSLEIKRPGMLLDGIPAGSWAYFVHSYMARPGSDVVTAESDYGGMVPAVVESGNYVGTQFHPEKSQSTGLRLIANFLTWRP